MLTHLDAVAAHVVVVLVDHLRRDEAVLGPHH